MTLTDTGSTIAVSLLGLALGVAIIAVLVSLRRRRYRGPFADPYAGFRTGARTERGGEFLQLECEGHCPGTTAHQITEDEVSGSQGATCVLCGTARPVPVPDEA